MVLTLSLSLNSAIGTKWSVPDVGGLRRLPIDLIKTVGMAVPGTTKKQPHRGESGLDW